MREAEIQARQAKKKKFSRPHLNGKKAEYGGANLSSQQLQEA
jgi:hypothetical protein